MWLGLGLVRDISNKWVRRCHKHLDTVLKVRVSVGGEVKVRCYKHATRVQHIA